jgi:hypothetical protein
MNQPEPEKKETIMYELVTPNEIAQSEKDAAASVRVARKLVAGKGQYHGYLFRKVPDGFGNVTLKIVAEYIDANGALQTAAEK